MNPTLLLQLLTSIPQLALGAFQYGSASKQARALSRPQYSIDPSYQNNINLLQGNMGLPQSALDSYYNNVGQATSSGLDTVKQVGGNGNDIAKILQGQSKNFQDVLVQDAIAKKGDINAIMLANTALADQKDKAFQLNELDPFKDKATAIANEKAAGLTNIQGAANSVSGAFANDATSKLYDNLFGTDKLSSTAPSDNGNGEDYYKNLVRTLMPQTGFQSFNNSAPNMNLGQNNFSGYGLPNYSLTGAPTPQFNQFAFNPYAFHF